MSTFADSASTNRPLAVPMPLESDAGSPSANAPISLPVNSAHRGAVFYGVENTLYAFEKAFDLGATAVELDVVCLSSGELAVFHGGGNHCNPGDVYDLCSLIEVDDAEHDEMNISGTFGSIGSSGFACSEDSYSTTASTQVADPETSIPVHSSVQYNEITPNHYFVEEMTLSQVRSLRFTTRSPGFAPLLSTAAEDFEEQVRKAEVPLLKDVLELCKSRGARVALEMKGLGVEHGSLRMVEELGMTDLVTFSSFHNSRTALIRRMRSDMSIRTGRIFDEQLPADWIEQCKSTHCNEAHVCFTACTPENMARAHAAGLYVMAWFPHPQNKEIWSKHTEDAVLYEKVSRSGVDMMCVNKPDLLKVVHDRMSREMAA